MTALHEVLEAVGGDNYKFQTLANAATGGKMRGKGRDQYLELTFGTKCATLSEVGILGTPTKIGVVVWVDAERWDNAIRSIAGAQS